MVDIVFFYSGINRAGSEIALLRYLKNTKINAKMLLVYGNRATDDAMVDEFKKVIEVRKMEEGEEIKCKVAVNCMISRHPNVMFDSIQAEKRIFWVQMNPKKHGNYMDFEKYDVYLTTSQYVSDIIGESEKTRGKKIYLSAPIVDTKEIRNLSTQTQDTLKENEINFVSIARVCPEKGYDYMLEIAKRLKQDGYHVKWYMIGFIDDSQQEYLQHLKTFIEENELNDTIIFMGAMNNPYKYLKRAYLNVLLSVDEAWGLAVNEARVLGIPSMASNNSALKEQIQDGVDGYLVNLPQNESDYTQIVDRVEQLIDNENLHSQMVEKLKEYEDTTEKSVKEMDQCLLETLKQIT